MKEVSKLSTKCEPLTPREDPNAIPTFKDIYSECVGRFRAKEQSAKKNMQILDLTRKLLKAEDTLSLENADFDLLKEAVDQNAPGYFPFYIGQAAEAIKDVQ